jgi:hypothetical protein
LPEQSSTRLTDSACSGVPLTPASAITGWNVPLVKSATDEIASLCRSSDFGEKTISGLRLGDRAWRRRRWK